MSPTHCPSCGQPWCTCPRPHGTCQCPPPVCACQRPTVLDPKLQAKIATWFSVGHVQRETILFRHWQALRRRASYRQAAQDCLRDLQTLYDELIMQQEMLVAPPALS